MEALCSRLRGLAQDCIDKHLPTSAIFYADKLVSFSNGAPGDVYLLAQAYYAARQFHRALSLLRTAGVIELGAEFTYLAGCCLAEAGEWEEVVALLGDDEHSQAPQAYEDFVLEPPGSGVRVQAGMCVLRARAFEALGNRARAAVWYQVALQLDPYCWDAFAALLDGHLLSNAEEVRLVEELALGGEGPGRGPGGQAGCGGASGGRAEGAGAGGAAPGLAETDRWLALLMRAKCKKYVQPEAVEAALLELEAPAPPGVPGEQGGRAEAADPDGAAAAAAGGQQQYGPYGTPYASAYGGAHHVSMSGALDPAAQGAVPGGVGAGGFAHPGDLLTRGSVAAPSGSGGVPFAIPFMTPPRAASHSAEAGAGARLPAGGEGVGGGRDGSGSNTATPASGAGSAAGTPDRHGHQRRGGRSGGRRGSRGAAAAGAGRSPGGEGTPGTDSMSDAGAFSPPAHQIPLPTTLLHAGAPGTHGQPATPSEPSAPQREGQGGGGGAEGAPAQGGGGGGGGDGSGWGCGLAGNLDVLACRAELLFHRGDFNGAYGLTRPVLLDGRDPFALQLLPVFLAAATQLATSGGGGNAGGGGGGAGPRTDLFRLGHRLTDEHPDMALSWYAVGCYYMAARHPDAARRHFAKATHLQRGFAPAWLAYGHAFAAQDERDQAMSAYRTAARLFPGLHTPHLGLGAEYCAMANFPLAERALLTAYDTCPDDPAVCHELGCLMYRCGQLAAAAMWLDRALQLLPGGRPTLHWEPTLVALGHCLRKLQRYGAAAECYQAALGLAPASPGTLTALGYVAQLTGDPRTAVEHYHAALALRPDDAFTTDMLRLALQEYAAADDVAAATAVGGMGHGGMVAMMV